MTVIQCRQKHTKSFVVGKHLKETLGVKTLVLTKMCPAFESMPINTRVKAE